jgi:hypothetical protein
MPKPLLILILVLLAVAGGYHFFRNQSLPIGSQPSSPIALPQGGVCDSETMTCSDGTVLKKTGTNCTFPPCPSDSAGPSAIPQGEEITITGITICLPHKNSNGPQTLECALGLKGDDGNNYGLSDPGWKYLMGVGNGTEVKIKGTLTKKSDSKYDSAGVIEIGSLVTSDK